MDQVTQENKTTDTTNSIDQASYDVAKKAIQDFKDEIAKLKSEISILRTDNLEKETIILQKDGMITTLETKLKNAENLVSASAVFKQPEVETPVVETPLSDIKLS